MVQGAAPSAANRGERARRFGRSSVRLASRCSARLTSLRSVTAAPRSAPLPGLRSRSGLPSPRRSLSLALDDLVFGSSVPASEPGERSPTGRIPPRRTSGGEAAGGAVEPQRDGGGRGASGPRQRSARRETGTDRPRSEDRRAVANERRRTVARSDAAPSPPLARGRGRVAGVRRSVASASSHPRDGAGASPSRTERRAVRAPGKGSGGVPGNTFSPNPLVNLPVMLGPGPLKEIRSSFGLSDAPAVMGLGRHAAGPGYPEGDRDRSGKKMKHATVSYSGVPVAPPAASRGRGFPLPS